MGKATKSRKPAGKKPAAKSRAGSVRAKAAPKVKAKAKPAARPKVAAKPPRAAGRPKPDGQVLAASTTAPTARITPPKPVVEERREPETAPALPVPIASFTF
jgi:hypothetical protein